MKKYGVVKESRYLIGENKVDPYVDYEMYNGVFDTREDAYAKIVDYTIRWSKRGGNGYISDRELFKSVTTKIFPNNIVGDLKERGIIGYAFTHKVVEINI